MNVYIPWNFITFSSKNTMDTINDYDDDDIRFICTKIGSCIRRDL